MTEIYRRIMHRCSSRPLRHLVLCGVLGIAVMACTSETAAPPPDSPSEPTISDAQGGEDETNDGARDDAESQALCDSDAACSEKLVGTIGACETARCDPMEGCVLEALSEGAACDDGDSCTEADQCLQGACLGTPRSCDDGDSCTIDSCEPDTANGCVYVAREGSCDDGDFCTLEDTCVDGVCSGTPVDCSPYATDCTEAVCDGLDGSCIAIARDDGTSCDDEDPCTVDDACLDGLCESSPMDCSALDSPCSAGLCDASTGECIAILFNEGGACDDDDPCTLNDSCQQGVCVGDQMSCPAATDPCQQSGCIAGACEVTSAPDGSVCDDGDLCTVGDTCSFGACSAGEPIVCDDGLICNGVESCDSSTGGCLSGQALQCDDGDACNGTEVCSEDASGCVPGAPIQCDDGDLCNGLETCDPSDGSCSMGTALTCDNGDPCDGVETCQPNTGACIAGIPMTCDDEDPCNGVEVCDSASGECLGGQPLTNGSVCGESSPCLGMQLCINGVCAAQAPVECPTPDTPCLMALCDAQTGDCLETNAPLGTPCDDDDPCTEGDACNAGQCAGTPKPTCDTLAPGVLCEASGAEGEWGYCELHVARACESIGVTGTLQFYFSWDPDAVEVSYFTDREQDPSVTPPFLDPLYQTYPGYSNGFAAPGYYPTCSEHPSIAGLCLGYTHLYNTGPGASAADWEDSMTIFVYTNGQPIPVVSGVLGEDETAEAPTHVFNLHYRMKQTLPAGQASPIMLTDVAAYDLDIMALETTVQQGQVITGDATKCP